VKRFGWRLQKLLDVKAQREGALRSELAMLTQRIARLGQDIIDLRRALGGAMARLAAGELTERIAVREVFVEHARRVERRVEGIHTEIGEITGQRTERTAEFMKLRAERQTLEKMRTEAHRRHVRLQTAEEQKQLDETSQIKFTRAAPEARRCMNGA